jgi:hypothetical protein
MMTGTDYRFNAYAVGKTREEVEKSARAQAEETSALPNWTFSVRTSP